MLDPLTAFFPPRRVAEFAGLSIRKPGKTGEFFSWIHGLLIIFISAFSVLSAMKKTAESGRGILYNPAQHLFGKGKSQTKGAGCRFNRRSRCEPVSGVAISSINEVRLLQSIYSFAMTTLPGALHQTKILPKQNSSEQRAASNEGFSSSLNSHYSLLATKLTGGKNE